MTRQIYFIPYKNKPVPKNLETLDTSVMNINRVNYFNYLGVIIDEKLNWHEQAENVCKSLLQFYGIFRQIKYYASRKLHDSCIMHVFFREYDMELRCLLYVVCESLEKNSYAKQIIYKIVTKSRSIHTNEYTTQYSFSTKS